MTPYEREAVEDLAEHLMNYLPGSPKWGRKYTFFSAAQATGVQQYWWIQEPHGVAVEHLLASVFEHQRGRFRLLVEDIVNNGMEYRDAIGDPVSRRDVDQLNLILRRAGAIVERYDTVAFRTTRPDLDSDERAGKRRRQSVLDGMLSTYLKLQDKTLTGDDVYTFARMLNRLLRMAGLERLERFTTKDLSTRGAFQLDYFQLLVRAELGQPVTLAKLLAFKDELTASPFGLGILLSVNGFEKDASDNALADPAPAVLLMDGAHLFRVLHGDAPLEELLRHLIRLLAEEKAPFVPISEPLARISEG